LFGDDGEDSNFASLDFLKGNLAAEKPSGCEEESTGMAIDIGFLESELMRMSGESVPGREFCEAISALAAGGRIEQLHGVLPSVVYAELRERFEQAPADFVAGWRLLGREMQEGFVHHARRRLTSLTRLQQAAEDAGTPAWQQIQLALDSQQNDLLRAAFALELLELVEPAVARATHLRECIVSSSCSEEADRYLDEATRCYFFGLFTACAVMCRSVLEEAIKQKLPPSMVRQVRSRYRNAPTLGNLLHEVNDNLRLTGIDVAFPALANRVNDVGRKAVHQKLLREEEARECLQNAREALELLLRESKTKSTHRTDN
jgi:hypothetical protein